MTTNPHFKVGDRCFSHYTRDAARGISGWGTIKRINHTVRNAVHGVTGDPLPDTTWYDIRADEGHIELCDDAHGTDWNMARIVPPDIAKRYGHGDDPAPYGVDEHGTPLIMCKCGIATEPYAPCGSPECQVPYVDSLGD